MSAGDQRGDSALKASEERLSLAQRALGFGVWDWDLLRQRVEWSPEMYAILGLDPVADAADPYAGWLRVLHPQDRQAQDELTRADAARGEGFSRTFRIVRPDTGEIRWIRTDATAVRDDVGRPVRMVGINLDVTEQHRANEALRESQAELRIIADSLPELISFIDKTCIYRFANRAFETWYGRDPAEIVGRDVRSVLGEAAYAVRRPYIERALAGEECSLDVEIARSDGSVRYGEARYLPHRDETGAIDGFHAYVIDITDRRRHEAAIRTTAERLRLATEGTGIGTYDIDLASGDGTLSPAAFRMLGLEPTPDGEVPYARWRERIHPDDLPRLERRHRKMAAKGGHWQVSYRVVRADGGEVRWLRTHGQFVAAPNGIRSVGVVMDITERKLDQQALAESEQRFRYLADAMPQLVWTADADGVVDYYNARRQAYVPTPQAVPDRWNWVPVVHPDDLERTVAAWQEASRQGAVYSCEHRLARADGTWAWHISRAVPVRSQGSDGVRWYGTATDIDALKQIQAQFAETAAALNALVANAPIGFAFFDRQHRYLRVNAVLAGINGLPPEAHVGRAIEDLLPVNALSVGPVLDRVFSTGEAVSALEVDGETPARPGERRSWLTGFFPVFAIDGTVVQVGATVVDITERKRAEAEVRASEARFRGVFESGALGFSIFDANTGETLAVNDRLLAMTGHSRAEFESGEWDWRVFTPAEHLPLDAAAVAEAQTRGFWAPFEKEFVDKCGRRVPVRLSSAPLPGEPGRVVAVIDDLTDVKAAQAKLRENEERLRLATENAEVGFWDVDVVNDVLHWPGRVKAMFGISQDAPVTMRDFYEGLHPEDRDATAAAYRAATDPTLRALYDVEYRTVGKDDGVVRWVAAKGRGVFDPDGRCLRVAGTAIDVTPRKLAEERLRDLNETLERRVEAALAERKLLADIVEGTDALVQVADRDFRWLAINKAAAREFQEIFGVRPRVGASMLDALAGMPEQQAAVKAVWSRALAGEQFTQVSEFGDPTRARRHYEMKYNSLRDAQGRLVGAYQFVYDVTQRMQEQERLRKAEDALRQAQKMEAVGQLTGGIAHDFNNLLQGVAGSLDLIRRRPAERERVQRWAEAGFKAAERGAKLTGQLLAFSRSQKLELRPIVISDLVTGFRDMLDRTIGALVRVRLDLATDSLVVLGDEVQIEMAVLNLALNARDAMPEGGDLVIRTRPLGIAGDPDLADGDYVELAIVDSGTGMSPDVIARAFDPFFTTKGLGKGTGLGLSQVYGAMRQAGGTVRIESREGAGTTVRLLLPRTEAPEIPAAPGAGALGPAATAARILVIDDDPDVRRFLTDSLDALGFGVVEADNGTSGLAALESAVPDAVILDFAMPELNGAEVARRIRARHPDLPIVFASGFAESSAIESAAGGESAVLRKPFGLDELQAVLTRMLARRL
ncbi:PAS domain S-box protein [uncultured Alsobacter sp.]|uniref:PAS domain S-box protein n=1 Tax=uncultured Alsobacter sp. TaxID=1748258 RepID=UPI0025FE5B05|nr:PAS domain S-box protein [uncultured Alsobacter sp.]